MEHKPWPLIILAFIHLIEPISKIIFYSIIFSVSPIKIVESFYQTETIIHQIHFYLLFPIAGIAIISVKKWSLPLFLFIECYVFIINLDYLYILYTTNQYLLFSSFIFFGFINIAIVSYLLIPAVRIAYLDPRIRWWESKPRYHTNIDCTINNGVTGKIQNISVNGVFVTTNYDIALDSNIEIAFNFKTNKNEYKIKPDVVILNKYDVKNTSGYGAVFHNLSKQDKKTIKSIIKYLEQSNATRRPPRKNPLTLYLWLKTFLTTGK